MKVIRLKNAPKGQPYGIEHVENPDNAEEVASQWWASGGTVALVILDDNGDEDARYSREYMDSDRVPDGWVSRSGAERKTAFQRKVLWTDALQALEKAPQVELPPKPVADLMNEDEPQETPQSAPVEGSRGFCPACTLPIPLEPYEGDPGYGMVSERIHQLRCPDCGRPIGPNANRMALIRAHLGGQSAKRPKPRGSQLHSMGKRGKL